MQTHILLIQCKDQSGLIAKITGILFHHRVNIISNAEYVERDGSFFFMRTEFSGVFDQAALQRDLEAALPEDVHIKLSDRQKKDIVILATKEHHCLSDLLVRHAFNEIEANIKAVISNYDTLQELTTTFKVPFHHISHEGKSREQHEAEIAEVVQSYAPEFIVLAKYMRILSAAFIDQYPNRIINIHHSFLPAFIGANPYVQAHARGVKIIGATAHFVNDNLDEGPIITQNVRPVSHSFSAREMAQAGRDVEKVVLATALNLVLNEQVFVHRNKTIVFG
jgi:formyltetrahydrofolate deformylase